MQVVTRCGKGGWVEVADDDDGHKHSYKLPRDQKGIRLHPLPAARVSDEPSVRKGVKRTATIDATIKEAQRITGAVCSCHGSLSRSTSCHKALVCGSVGGCITLH